MTKKILPCNTGGAFGAWDSQLWPRYFYIACLQVVLACVDFPWESNSGLDTYTSLGEFPLAEQRRGISYR